ncbi:hypothetical protein PI124_g23726 [Phytophthora idaei]|nr:hypothetical protein PI125_g18312 [Phytophthora idaei]KAG3156105.1 hypothetical protein PI126_g8890 [Phytophthora idaei]KAG3231180.1 hypothetical protein PI124_g23726 [Phytophthora idaei]
MSPQHGTYSTAQLKQQQAVRILGESALSMVDITAALLLPNVTSWMWKLRVLKRWTSSITITTT